MSKFQHNHPHPGAINIKPYLHWSTSHANIQIHEYKLYNYSVVN